MSYRFCVFAVSAAEVSEQALLLELFAVVRELATELSPPMVFVRFSSEATANECGLRLFVLETRGGDRLLDRAPILERLADGRDVTAFGHDDQCGVHVYEHRASTSNADGRGASRALRSVGPILQGDVEGIHVPYPQRGFTAERIADLLKAPAHTLSLAERAAAYDWASAIDVALRAYHPRTSRAHLRAPLESETAWQLFDPGKALKRPAARKAPKDLRPLVAHGVVDAPPVDLETELVVPRIDMDSRALVDAINRLNRAIALTHETDAWARCMRARAHALDGDIAAAITDAARAVELDPEARAALRADADIMRFAHVPELRELLELGASPVASWPSRLEAGWSTLGFVCAARLRARPTWPAELIRVGRELSPTGYSFYGGGGRAKQAGCAWVALEQPSGEVLVVRPDGRQEHRIGGDIAGGVRPLGFDAEGALHLELRSSRHETRVAAPPDWTPRTPAEVGVAWFERGAVVEAGNPTTYEWLLHAPGDDRRSPIWRTVTFDLAPPVRTSRGWLWLAPRPPKGAALFTLESGEVRERLELEGGLATVAKVRGDDVLLCHGGAFSRYDAATGSLTQLLRGAWARYQWPKLSPSGALACRERLRDGLDRLIVVRDPDHPVPLGVEGVRGFEWVDDMALVVADCAGLLRLVSTEPGDQIVELGDAHLF